MTAFDAHYFYQNAWAAKHIFDVMPALHVDVGSDLSLIGTLSSAIPTVFVDIRPLSASLDQLHRLSADGLHLPFPNASLSSISCLHVAEHVGLGRYGDALDPYGTEKLCRELERVLAAGGRLLLSVPIGRSRVCFNAHRVLAPRQVIEYFPELVLLEAAAVTDDAVFVAPADLDGLANAGYACGMYNFTRI
ncbi:MAG TPA: DUF268 domain-containing protein [Acidimicrobiales bacterium]|nr:DUF268 domain-containing protein [Acidimicrobiales bacterium]